jgi:copper(I)-binding protein
MTAARRSFVFLGLATWALGAAVAGPAALDVQGAWVRQVPGSDVAAAYMTLRNTGARPVTVIGVQCPLAESAMIHETKVEGGLSKMRPQSALAVPPGQSVTLAPDGRHVMLMGVRPLTVGQSVPLVLKLDDGSSVRVNAAVRPLTAQ